MKKKRFKKLIMARGVQKNEAEAMANEIAIYGSYVELYKSLRLWLAFYQLKMGACRAGRAAIAFGRAFCNSVNDAVNGLHFGMDIANTPDQTAFHHQNTHRDDGVDAALYSVEAMGLAGHSAVHNRASGGLRAEVVIADDLAARPLEREKRSTGNAKSE